MIDIVISNEEVNREKCNKMIEMQNQILDLEISNDDTMVVDEYSNDNNNNSNNNGSSEDGIPKFNEKKRKRKRKSKVNDNNKTYEIEKIVDHRFENNRYEFYIKWKYYSDEYNTWIPTENFNEKDMLKDYLELHKVEL